MFKREQVFASTLEYFQGDALAADVFVNKYCLQDDHGFYETTPQKMHWRLAQEFARPDLKYKFKLDDLPSVKEGWTKPEYYEFYAERVTMYFHLIDRFKFVIPQGSPMSALGNPYQIQSASNCFAPGTEVHTKNGSKPIESVQIGDEVVTHKDRYRKVVQIHKNKLDKRRLYKFKAYRTPFICVTENHEFLSISKEQLGWGMSPQWNSIGYLRVGDYIQIPSNVESAETSRLDFGRNSEIRTKSNKKYMDARVLENLSDFTQHKIEIDGKTFVQITSKDLCEEEFEFVYTLGVEEDHSYSVEGLICKNCFVLPSVEDSYSQIMKTDQELAQLSKRRGGVGFDISKLRPEGAPVSNAAKTSSGIVSFMERFSNTTREVGQNGRRAALLMSCSVHHPDIEKFITIKSDRTKVTGANISVAITDEFMKAVIEDIDYEQRWPCEGVEPKIRRVKRARDIWDLIIKNAWENAEPGVIFIDKMRNYPGQHYDGYEVVSTNPCGR